MNPELFKRKFSVLKVEIGLDKKSRNFIDHCSD